MRFVAGSTETLFALATVAIVVIAVSEPASTTVTFCGVVCEHAKL